RIDGSKVNKRVIESLTKAGAFDSFGYTRKSLLSQIEKIVDTVGKAATAKKMMTGSLFGDSEELTKIDIELEHLNEFDPKELLEFEKATLGFYVSGHPLDEYKKDLEKINFTLSSQIDELEDGSQALFVGKIESITEKTSKKGNKFGIVSILDFHGTIEFMLFEDKLKELQDEYNHEEPIAFKVRISKNESFTRISVLKIETIFDAQKEKLKIKQKEVQEPPLNIAIAFSEDENIMYKLFDIIANNQGKRELKLIIKSKLADLELETGFKVTSNVENLIKQLEGVYLVDETYTTDK
ncbi:DNA polymerase III subunit alpha, partial [Aliarcobacter butzleri]|nr:DNA polymerase III subunit alpha [Aliarcobacter butzleri]